MTAQPTEQPVIEPAPHVVNLASVRAERLADLHARYADAKANADAANEALDALKSALKAELAQTAALTGGEGATRIDLIGPDGPALRLTYVESWRIDSRRLKAQDPETWVRYAKQSGSWALKPLGGADE